MKRTNIVFGGAGVLLSAYVLLKTREFPRDAVMNIGPAFFPRVLALGLLIFSIVLIISNILSREPAGTGDPIFDPRDPGVRRAGIALLATAVYVVLMGYLSFIATTIIYLCFLMYLMKMRNYLKMAVVSVGVTLVIFTIFRTLLNITLPTGFWT